MQRISPENTVIAILCRDRLKYLIHTWNSLQKSMTHVCPIYIYDDGSTNPELNRFLTTNYDFELTSPIDINCPVLSKYVGTFPVISSISGISSFIKLKKQNKSIGNTEISFKLVAELFDENPQINYIIKLEDDVVFKENWMEDLMDAWNGWSIINPGVLCSCSISNIFRKKTSYITTCHNPSFQLALFSRDLYEIDKDYFRGSWKYKTKVDLYTKKFCDDNNVECGLLGASVCQHIGVESIELTRYSEYFSKSYTFDRRLDLTVEPPFVI